MSSPGQQHLDSQVNPWHFLETLRTRSYKAFVDQVATFIIHTGETLLLV